ncbi:hypothetical protein [Nocardioides sp. NPDC006303]|uniref:hypothetical protein n=1 Tax=Nocardioides sp. NPDC006303 TaxID=3156747 RepID=UPI0033AAAB6A
MKDDVEAFLIDAADFAGGTVDDVLARVLHVGDGAFAAVVAAMDNATKMLAMRLDREIRVRNPGLQYVVRSMFVGYRREGDMPLSIGERSQIFVSVIRNSSRLEVVLPLDPDSIVATPNVQDLRGKGHHGVGDVRVSMHDDSDIDRFLRDFDYWLRPRP